MAKHAYDADSEDAPPLWRIFARLLWLERRCTALEQEVFSVCRRRVPGHVPSRLGTDNDMEA